MPAKGDPHAPYNAKEDKKRKSEWRKRKADIHQGGFVGPSEPVREQQGQEDKTTRDRKGRYQKKGKIREF
jgi:hypothetical protein